jgi:hypothetical protein
MTFPAGLAPRLAETIPVLSRRLGPRSIPCIKLTPTGGPRVSSGTGPGTIWTSCPAGEGRSGGPAGNPGVATWIGVDDL